MKLPARNLLLGATFLAACGQNPPQHSSSSTTRSEAVTAKAALTNEPIGPKFTLVNPIIDFGEIDDFETRTAQVSFTNTGDQPLEIKEVKPTCGCTTVKLEKRIFAPGEGDSITLNFTPKGAGEQTKYVKIHTTDPKTPVTNLPIKSNVRTTVQATPRTFSLGEIPVGKEYRASRKITGNNPGYVPTSVSISGNLKQYARASLIETTPQGAEKRTWQIDLVLDKTLPWGSLTGNADVRGTVKTPDRIYPHKYSLGITVLAKGELNSSEKYFRLSGLNPGQKVSRKITITRENNAPFEIIGTALQGNSQYAFEVIAIPNTPEKNSWDVIISGTAPQRTSIIKGKVIVETNVTGEERLEFLYNGNVRKPS